MSDESAEVIEQQMQETRDSLTLKVSALENQVVDTLQNASETVSNIVDSVKSVVPDTLAGMKETVTESMKETFDVSEHTRVRPWAMVGGAAALGFIAGMVLFRRRDAAAVAVASGASIRPMAAAPAPVAAPQAPRLPGWLDQIVDRLVDKVGSEVRKLGDVALATASESLQKKVEETLPRLLGNASAQDQTPVPAGDLRNGFRNATTGY